jgi:teichuronic acid exporter
MDCNDNEFIITMDNENKLKEQEIEISRKTKQSIAWFTITPTLLHIIRFVSSIVLARILVPADFGIVGIATIILYYCNSFTNFGFSKAIIQKKNITPDHYNVYFTFNIIMSVIFYITLNVFSHEIAHFFQEPLLELVIEATALLFLISSLEAVPMTDKVLTFAELLRVFISISISLLLALNGFGYWSIIYAMLLSNFFAMLLVRFSSDISPSISFKGRVLRDLFSFGIWDFIWGQAKIIGDNINKIIIGRELSVTALGFFDKAEGLAKMPNDQFSRRLGMVSFSTFSRVQDSPEELDNYITKIMVLNSFVTFPLYVGLFSVAEDFTLVLLGEKWSSMIQPLEILSWSFLVASISTPLASANIALYQAANSSPSCRFNCFYFIVTFVFSRGYRHY